MALAENEMLSPDDHGLEEILKWLAKMATQNDDVSLKSVTFDVGGLLRPDPSGRVLVLRISPRPPVDAVHTLATPDDLRSCVAASLTLRGGHDSQGREFRPLDLASLRNALSEHDTGNGVVAAITAVGSTGNPEHERRAADVILDLVPGARISLSHSFYAKAFRDRDYTTTLNASLLVRGEQLAERFDLVAAKLLPGVPVSFGLNDGGRAPIRLLGATPVHAVRATPALRVQGARQLADLDDGDVAIIDEDSAVVGHVQRGVPAAQGLVRRGDRPGLASNVGRVEQYSPRYVERANGPSAVVDSRFEPDLDRDESKISYARVDLGALGAAVAPLSVWSDSLRYASNSDELRRILRDVEEDLRSQCIHWGAGPESTRLIESSAVRTAYGSRDVVRVRVRVIGDWVTAK
jgi:hypothetical protein